MTESDRVRRAFLRAVSAVKRVSPYSTGNLRMNAIKQIIGKDMTIYVDTRVAPYMKYTNESWDRFKPPLRGKQNPNEDWWGRAAEAAARSIARDLKGKIE